MMESAVSGPMPFMESSSARSLSGGALKSRVRLPPWRSKRWEVKCLSLRAFTLKYPAGRISSASSPSGAACIPAGVRRDRFLRFLMARSTFVQAVFWVRMAPTMTSNRVLAGHQPCGPKLW